jgi:hypothetical protein
LEANAPDHEEHFQISEEHTNDMEEHFITPKVDKGIHQKFGSIRKANAEGLEELNETLCAVAK